MNLIVQKPRNILIATVLLFFTLFGVSILANTNAVNAQNASKDVCESVGGTWNGSSCTEGSNTIGGSNINSLLATVLNILSFVAGVISVIMIIVAGIKFITSQGDAGKVSSARNTVIYAVVGIVIVLLSQIIVRFVLNQATNAGSTTPPPASTAPANAQ